MLVLTDLRFKFCLGRTLLARPACLPDILSVPCKNKFDYFCISFISDVTHLTQQMKLIHLLIADVDWLIHQNPGYCLPAPTKIFENWKHLTFCLPWVGCAALIGDIFSSGWQDAVQRKLVQAGDLPAELDVAQLVDDGPEAGVHVVVVHPGLLALDLDHEGHGHHPPHTRPGHAHVGVQVTVITINLNFCREAVMIDGMLRT